MQGRFVLFPSVHPVWHVVGAGFHIGHHVASWHAHTHPVFGQPACSVVDGNAQKPERVITTRVVSAIMFLRVFISAVDLRANKDHRT